MKKAREILNGVVNSISKSDKVETLSKNRLAVCFLCPKNVNNKCTACGCNLQLKSRSIKSNCPDGKW